MKWSVQPYKHREGHALEVFLTQMEGVGAIRIGGPLHVDVHLIYKQISTLSVGTTRDSVRMPESCCHRLIIILLGRLDTYITYPN